MHVLIVDDDPKFRGFLSQGLQESGISTQQVESVDRAFECLEEAREAPFDVILLDVMMPERSGWELLESLRKDGDNTPVIFLTARHEVSERVKGLELGADDYVIKPFDFEELLARIQAVVRRRKSNSVLEAGPLRIDLARRIVERDGRRIETSPREFELLHALAERAGETYSRAELLRRVWNLDFDPGTNVVDVLVARLRRKLDVGAPRLIETVVSEGYRLDVESGS